MSAVEEYKAAMKKYPPKMGDFKPGNLEVIQALAIKELIERVEQLEALVLEKRLS